MTATDSRVRRLEKRVSRLESAGRVPPEAAEAYARLVATAPVSEAEQARHRQELLAALRSNA
jgi:hypothetical protein